MATYLLTWNPKRWTEWHNLQDMADAVERGERVPMDWSIVNKHIVPGDRVFMIRLGTEPKGIFASGFVISQVKQQQHWDPERRARGIPENYVDLEFDALLNPENMPILPRHFLNSPPFSDQHWDAQNSGIEIRPHVAVALEAVWKRHLKGLQFAYPEEVEETGRYIEGAVRRVAVNAYERDPRARRACIEHYGVSCCVCGFNFFNAYGEAGRDYIQVHHLRPLAERGEVYEVDPVRDLRPVCPNCHAIIHRKSPAYKVEEVRRMIRSHS